jgi:hypothetical protein
LLPNQMRSSNSQPKRLTDGFGRGVFNMENSPWRIHL